MNPSLIFPARLRVFAVALLFLSGATGLLKPVYAQGAQSIVAAQSVLRFVSRQMGVPVQGRFTRVEGNIQFDIAQPAASRIDLRVPLSSVEIGDDATAAELRKPGWFDTAAFPQARFESTAVRALGGDRYAVQGRFSLKGKTLPLNFNVRLTRAAPLSYAEGEFTLHRLAYGVGSGEWNDVSLVADEVTVNFKIAIAGL